MRLQRNLQTFLFLFLFSSVNTHMTIQVVLVLESHCADFADEGPVFRVAAHVVLQIPRVRERLATDVTAEPRLVGMNQ